MPVISTGYKIHTGSRALGELDRFLSGNKNYSRYFILCDDNTVRHCLPLLVSQCRRLKDAEVLEVESGERSKDLAVCSQLWQTLISSGAGKDTLIINLGGGVVSDLGGFVASVYKRGLDYVNVPTSLLAMADASVGGKTGIDMAGVKNVIGTISPPKGVFVYGDFLKTLSSRHVYNGLAEICKIALVADKVFWRKLSGEIKQSDRDPIIVKSIRLKNVIVKKDPLEKGLRKILNFGHSIGHAIEGALAGTEYELLHGEAIVAGMICEAWIAQQKKLITKKELGEVLHVLLRIFSPQPVPEVYNDKIMSLILNDKKNRKGQMLFALIRGIGTCSIDVPVTTSLVKRSLHFYNDVVK